MICHLKQRYAEVCGLPRTLNAARALRQDDRDLGVKPAPANSSKRRRGICFKRRDDPARSASNMVPEMQHQNELAGALWPRFDRGFRVMWRHLGFPDHPRRIFVVSKRNELGMSQVIGQ